MRAPRALANSSSSSTSTPAPSPSTKPSRSRSKGRLDRSGSSLRVDSARMAPKPPIPIAQTAASEPPAIITSAAPRRMISEASPRACAEAVHAVHVAELGPCAPKRIDTWPDARLMMADGMKKGEIRRGPPSSRALCSRSIVVKPPIPDAMKTPTRGAISGVTFSPESSIANCEAAMANWMKMSIFLTSFFSMNRSGSKAFTSAAKRVENAAASNRVIGPMPLRPARSDAQVASVPMPTEDTSPMPVTTTRLLNLPPPRTAARTARNAPVRLPQRRLLLVLGVRLDVLDGFLHARDLLGVLVGDLDPEFLFERHHQLHRVKRIGAEVFDERGIIGHLFLVHTELLHDDALDFLRNRHSSSYVYIPPFTARTCPVIYDASSDARKHTAAATSSGAPRRPSGICCDQSCFALPTRRRVMSVSMSPGATTFTVMLREATSRASALQKPISPAFEAA